MDENNEKRKLLLKQLIEHPEDLDALSANLDQYDWDFEGDPEILQKDTIKNVLDRYLKGNLKASGIHEWADFLELRDDVDYLQSENHVLSAIMHELANPDLEGVLTIERANFLLSKL